RQFSEKDKDYFVYQARQNYLRQQMTVYGELDATKLREQEALAKLDAVTLREQQTALREQQALEEIERLKALLAEKKS
ncbi:MAG: hypothetical protein NT008_02770, partial [Methylococcales bacterium]|nr:hypothetical protein [Methylococcales bacterium]